MNSTHLLKINRRDLLRHMGSLLLALLIPLPLKAWIKNIPIMNKNDNQFDVIIIGGSYAGLSAAMSLGRALRKVLIIDSGKPCNEQTPHAHNLITHDGENPNEIRQKAKKQTLKYNTIKYVQDLAIKAEKTTQGFNITTQSNQSFNTRKLIFASGLNDLMPDIKGYRECWGISILHCPYCHGYEVKSEKTGIIGNGDFAFEFIKMISHWTKELTLFTNGKSTLTEEQTTMIQKHGIPIVETEIKHIDHQAGKIQQLVFKDQSTHPLVAVYGRPAFKQHCDLPEQLGCALTEHGLLKTDAFQRTTIKDVYACGDNSNMARALSLSISSGSMTGAFVNKEMIDEKF